jgi:hypothetical protein
VVATEALPISSDRVNAGNSSLSLSGLPPDAEVVLAGKISVMFGVSSPRWSTSPTCYPGVIVALGAAATAA